MKMLIFSLLLPLLLGSCAPKVLTHIEKKYPSRVVADEVHLYGVGQTVPETAERIGSVRVVDGGASTKCNYEQVVALAKQETAKSGGAEALDARHTGSKVLLAQILAGVGIAVHARAKNGQQHDDDDQDQAQHGAPLAEEAEDGILPEALGRKVGIHGDLIVVVLEGKLLVLKGVLGIQGIHRADDGIRCGFAAQADRFFCHISHPHYQ